jgi:hypothetical protein
MSKITHLKSSIIPRTDEPDSALPIEGIYGTNGFYFQVHEFIKDQIYKPKTY